MSHRVLAVTLALAMLERLAPVVLASAVVVTACGPDDESRVASNGGTAGEGGGGAAGATGSGGTAGAALTCVPGVQVTCDCPGGSKGAQVCEQDGRGYGACFGCGTGAGGAAGAGGTSGAAGAGGTSGAAGVGMSGAGGQPVGPSCGELAVDRGWVDAKCESGGNDACGGQGEPTWDCDFCCGATSSGFGYPVGDKSTNPAGGWNVWQVMAHYWADQGGRHLAQDVSHPSGGAAAVGAAVYSVADGTVLYAKPNSSSYLNVVLIEHPTSGGRVCSFYGHIKDVQVAAGQPVSRGDRIASIASWAEAAGGAVSNTHLHYVLLSDQVCAHAAATGNSGGSNVCGYDGGGPSSVAWADLSTEPYFYTSVSDPCGTSGMQDGFISPSKYIADHHF